MPAKGPTDIIGSFLDVLKHVEFVLNSDSFEDGIIVYFLSLLSHIVVRNHLWPRKNLRLPDKRIFDTTLSEIKALCLKISPIVISNKYIQGSSCRPFVLLLVSWIEDIFTQLKWHILHIVDSGTLSSGTLESLLLEFGAQIVGLKMTRVASQVFGTIDVS